MLRPQDTVPGAATMAGDEVLSKVFSFERSYIGTKWYQDADGVTRKPTLKAIVTNTFDGTAVHLQYARR